MFLREDFQKIISTYGFNAFLIRQDTRFRCWCWDQAKQSASDKCPSCLGLGYVPSIERHTIFQSIDGQLSPTENKVAVIVTENIYFYFAYNSFPKQGDLVCITDFNATGIPIGELSFYKVANVYPYRIGKNGTPEIQYYRTVCSLDPVDTKVKALNFRKVGGEIKIFPILS